MPIYEYECCSCCDKFERLVFRSDEPVNCPKCESENVQRVMSVCGFKSGGGGRDTGDNGAAASRNTSSKSSCSGCRGGSCSTCH
jgi:putative FmdB family regulatory protein